MNLLLQHRFFQSVALQDGFQKAQLHRRRNKSNCTTVGSELVRGNFGESARNRALCALLFALIREYIFSGSPGSREYTARPRSCVREGETGLLATANDVTALVANHPALDAKGTQQPEVMDWKNGFAAEVLRNVFGDNTDSRVNSLGTRCVIVPSCEESFLLFLTKSMRVCLRGCRGKKSEHAAPKRRRLVLWSNRIEPLGGIVLPSANRKLAVIWRGTPRG
jgi:hypothetical protein